MLITQVSEDEAIIALHDNALDLSLTIEALLEGSISQVLHFCF